MQGNVMILQPHMILPCIGQETITGLEKMLEESHFTPKQIELLSCFSDGTKMDDLYTDTNYVA